MPERPTSLDLGALDHLRDVADGDEKFLSEIVDDYLADAPGQLDTIDHAVASGAADEALRAAHTLKSTSATFGARTLEGLAREIEGLAREGRLREIDSLSRRARQELGSVTLQLRELDLGGAEQ
ncbi:MAG: Hpt domain-containing protein [Chloroflexota bacterium]|nr:Hpt domain-containing protein [Chloroflexota bacterium]